MRAADSAADARAGSIDRARVRHPRTIRGPSPRRASRIALSCSALNDPRGRGAREVGANPTRCRHCEWRVRPPSNARSLQENHSAACRGRWDRTRGNPDPRARRPATPADPSRSDSPCLFGTGVRSEQPRTMARRLNGTPTLFIAVLLESFAVAAGVSTRECHTHPDRRIGAQRQESLRPRARVATQRSTRVRCDRRSA